MEVQHRRLTARRSWVLLPGGEGLSVFSLHVLHVPPQSKTWILEFISSLDVVPGSLVAAHCSPEEDGSDAGN